jgi:hypothetical protein
MTTLDLPQPAATPIWNWRDIVLTAILGTIGAVYLWAAVHYANHMPLVPLLLLALPYVAILAGLIFAAWALAIIIGAPGYSDEIDQ